jgi:glyoxylase-like metal-dependent hydrolase (beta-lactamase superfamily II)
MTSAHRDPESAVQSITRWQIGEAVVHQVVELDLSNVLQEIFPPTTPTLVAGTSWLQPPLVGEDRSLRGVAQVFAIELAGRRILVDTGIGNGKSSPRPSFANLDTPLLDRLTSVGFAPDAVDLVLTTHLHVDHVGWNTRRQDGRWVSTFPNARHVVVRAEDAYWAEADLPPARRQVFVESVDPLRETGRLDLVDVPAGGTEIVAGFRLLPAPGHTPHQIVVRLDSGARSALIGSDWVHHPLQLAHPEVSTLVDVDPAQAARTHETLLAELAGTDTLLLGGHFLPGAVGVVRRDGDAYRLLAVTPPAG